MKRNIRLLRPFLAAALLAGCNGSFGRFFDNPLASDGPAIKNSAITVSSFDTASVTLGFAEASDRTDTPDQLTYLVVYSSVAAVDSISDPASLPDGVQSYGWLQYPTTGTVTISSLAAGTSYNVNIIVKNSRNRFSLYSAASATTAAAPPPVVSSPALTITSQTATTAALSFAAATGTGTLTYMIVYSTADELSSITDYNALPSGATKIGWQSYPSPITVTSLAPNTTYFINVIVKTDLGAFAVYDDTSFTTEATDLPTVPSASLTSLAVDESSITFSFDEAVNNSGAQSSLLYKIVSDTSDSFGSVSNPDSLGGTWLSYPAAPSTISSLAIGTTYYYTVFVKNSYGFARYATASATPHDVTAPAAGNITLAQGTDPTKQINVTYTAGHDNVSLDTALQYKVVCAESEIDQANTANAITTSPGRLQDWQSFTVNGGTLTASDLSPNTTYYFNVLVRDEAGNMTLYACKSATTTANNGDTHAPTLSPATVTASAGTSQWLASLVWTKATDPLGADDSTNTNDPAALKYKVVASTSSISEGNYASMPVVSNDWETNIGSLSNIPVADGVTTNFMVAVKDEAGNVSCYNAVSYTPSMQPSLL